jgi:hypothetical protein
VEVVKLKLNPDSVWKRVRIKHKILEEDSCLTKARRTGAIYA